MNAKETLFITDSDGYEIEVTNIEQAIEQVTFFKGLKHTDPKFADFDKQMEAYWKHAHEQLLNLKHNVLTNNKVA